MTLESNLASEGCFGISERCTVGDERYCQRCFFEYIRGITYEGPMCDTCATEWHLQEYGDYGYFGHGHSVILGTDIRYFGHGHDILGTDISYFRHGHQLL